MEKKLITPGEKTTMFNKWLNNQEMPECYNKEERQRWWITKVLEFDKMTAKDYEVAHINQPGEE